MTADAAPAPAPRWRERWAAWRDRVVASPDFQRRAAAWPVTRWVARRRARQVFDLVAGFVYSQVLLACVRLQLFDRLAAGPRSAEQLASLLGLPLDATRRLLDAARALRLLERRGDALYGLGPLGAPLVGQSSITSMVEHHAALYADLADPVALLRGERPAGALARYWPYAAAEHGPPPALGPADVDTYSALMTASQPLVADQVLDAYDVRRHRLLMDVGGGEGRFLMAAAARAPALRLRLVDLPAVAERARLRLAAGGLAGRSETLGLDFLRDPLPAGADLVSLVRVVHDHDDDRVMQLLKAVHGALVPGGTLLLAEPMADTPGAEAMGDAYFGFYLLAMGSGRPRSARALSAMLEAAGFEDVRHRPTHLPLQASVLTARRAA